MIPPSDGPGTQDQSKKKKNQQQINRQIPLGFWFSTSSGELLLRSTKLETCDRWQYVSEQISHSFPALEAMFSPSPDITTSHKKC